MSTGPLVSAAMKDQDPGLRFETSPIILPSFCDDVAAGYRSCLDLTIIAVKT
jgi:hypothetical protein